MADNKKEIEYFLKLYHQEYGGDKVLTNLKQIVNVADSVKKGFKSVGDSANDAAKGVKQITSAAASAVSVFNGLLKPIGLTGFSLDSILKTNDNLNKSLRSIGNEFLKYGIGFSQLDSRINKFAISNRMLRSEVMGLANTIQHGFRDAAGNFENIIKLFERMVGNNPQAIQQQISNLSALSNEYIGLGRAITSVGENGLLSEYQKGMLELYADLGDATGSLSRQQTDMLKDMLASQKNINKEDKERRDQLDAQINALRTFEQTQERIIVQLASQLMPVVQKVSDFIQNFNTEIVSTAKYVAYIVAGFSALKGTLSVLNSVGQIGAFGLGYAKQIAAGLGGTAAGSVAAGSAAAAGTAAGSVAAGTAATGTAAAGTAAAGMTGAAFLGAAGLSAGTAAAGLFAGNSLGETSLGESIANFLLTGGGINKGILGSSDLTGLSASEYRSGENSLNKDLIRRYSKTFGKMFSSASSPEELGLIESQRVYFELSEKLRKEQVSKQTGLFNNVLNIGSGGASYRITDEEKEIMKEMKYQAEIIKENKKQFLNRKKLTEEKEKLDIADKIKKTEEEIFKLEDATTKKRQQQRLELDLMRQNLESQKNVMQSQFGLVSSIADRIRALGGNRSMNSLFGAMNTSSQFSSGFLNQSAYALSASQSVLNDVPSAISGLRDKKAIEIKQKMDEVVSLRRDLEKINSDITGENDDKKYAELIDKKKTKMLELQSKEHDIKNADNEVNRDSLKIYNEATSKVIQAQNDFNKAIIDGAEAYRAMYSVKDFALELQSSAEAVAQSQVSLADNLAMGIAASSEMRMQASDQIAKNITILQEKMLLIDRTEAQSMKDKVIAQQKMISARNEEEKMAAQGELDKAEMSLLKVNKDRLDTENSIYGKMQQQAQLLRTLRDGYISAINAMNTGAGVFSKIIIDQNKNLGILMQQGLSPVAIRTGSSAGGFLSSERFTSTGISSSEERARNPIVKPEWGITVGFNGINGRGPLADIARSVSQQIPQKVSEMSADMSSVADNVNNLSRLFGVNASGGASNLQGAKNSVIPSVGDFVESHINKIRGDRDGKNHSSPILSGTDKKEISKIIAKELGSLIKDAVVAAKEDIMSEIHKGLG